MDFVNKQPIYKQIAGNFCETVLKKEWQANEKIPSVRDIAVQAEVNPNTAIRAYTYLQEQGIIYNKRGLGYFVSEDGYTKALEMRKTEFIDKDLPYIFKTMNLLGLKIEDIIQFYKNNI